MRQKITLKINTKQKDNGVRKMTKNNILKNGLRKKNRASLNKKNELGFKPRMESCFDSLPNSKKSTFFECFCFVF